MNGLINVLKPTGISSNDVVTRLRRILGESRIGHTGTLDPAAAGVLPVLLGRSVRISQYLLEKDKEYVTRFAFGVETDTLDAQGKVTGTAPVTHSREQLQAALDALTGDILQVPPQYSAVKLAGKTAYQLAREGKQADIAARPITVHRLELLEAGERDVLLRIHCSKGAYVRSLCRDLAGLLGTVGHVTYLLRTRSGPYRLEDALTMEQVAFLYLRQGLDAHILSPESILQDLPAVHLPAHRAAATGNGLPTSLRGAAARALDEVAEDQPLRIYVAEEFYGLGFAARNGEQRDVRLEKHLR